MASTYINSPNGTGTDPQIATFSMWFKITKPEATEVYLFSGGDGASNNSWLRVQGGTGQLYFRNRTSSSNDCVIQTNAQYRDVNGWHHVVLKLNSTLSTAADRATMYVNGEEITSFSSSTDMTQNNLFHMFGATITHIGKRVNDGSTGNLGGFLASHVHFCDGYAYDASAFGEYDANGVWKIKTSPSVTYGTRGFFILKDGNSVTDQSGNSNNFTVGGGTLTNTEDSPSNVFCVLNKLQKPYPAQSNTLGFGNTKYADNNASWQRNYGTIGATTGKWFYEFKNLQDNNNTGECRIGWDSIDFINDSSDNYYSGLTIDRAGKLRGGIKGVSGYSPNEVQMTAAYSGGDFTFTANDILGMAIDLDNETFSVYKNGNLEIDAYSYAGLSNNSISKSRGYFIAPSINWYSSTGDVNRGCFNFGNGYFETTAVSSAGTNASGIGIFEYDVPTGYTALSTKGLNL